MQEGWARATRLRVRWSVLTAIGLSLAFPAQADSHSDLRKEARRTPKDPETALDLGRRLRHAGLFRESAHLLQRAYLNQRKVSAVAALRFERARALIGDQKQKHALRECQLLVKVEPIKGHACVAEAQLVLRRASLAIPAAEKALSLSPNDYDAKVAFARALFMKGQPGPAKDRFDEAIAIDTSRPEAHRYLGEMLAASGDSSAALSSLKKAHQADAGDPEIAFALAEALGADAEAERLLVQATKIRPTFGEAHAALGKKLLERGEHSAAETSLRAALKIDDKQAGWHALMGRLLLDLGKPDEALAASKKALSIVANNADAKLVEADALAAKGRIDLAIEAYSLAASWARANPAPLVHAAVAMLAGGRPTTARAFADRAVAEFPKWGPAWEAAGDVFAHQKDKANAKKAYRKALRGQGPVDKAAVKKKLEKLR